MDVRKFLPGATAAAGLLAASAASASAAIVCAGPVCWHTHEAYDNPPDARVVDDPDQLRCGLRNTTRGGSTRPWLLARRPLDGVVGRQQGALNPPFFLGPASLAGTRSTAGRFLFAAY